MKKIIHNKSVRELFRIPKNHGQTMVETLVFMAGLLLFSYLLFQYFYFGERSIHEKRLAIKHAKEYWQKNTINHRREKMDYPLNINSHFLDRSLDDRNEK